MFVLANVLQPLIDFFKLILEFFHDTLGLGWGMSIVAMTLAIRVALMPLTMKQMRSMQHLAQHQPELKKLQEKYKGDRERMNQEMMKFYRENQINPFSSCLPLLAQLPVFISLFYMLQGDLRDEICPGLQPATGNSVPCGATEASEFLFIADITDRAGGGVLVLLLVLYVLSQMLSTVLSTMTADRTQRLIFLFLPLFFLPFIWTFPAGLLVYWITTNLWTIVQGVIVRRSVGPIVPPGAEDAPEQTAWQKFLGIHPKAPAPAVAAGNGEGPARKGRTSSPPPPPPRKKKKRSGRRR